MRERIKHILRISIVVGILASLYFLFTANYQDFKMVGVFVVGCILLHMLIPNKKIKIDHNGNAIKKNK